MCILYICAAERCHHLRGRVLLYLLVQLDHQFAHQFHFLQQQTDHNESRVIAQFLHHQIGPILFDCTRIIRTAPYRRIELIRFIQIIGFACPKAKMRDMNYIYHS